MGWIQLDDSFPLPSSFGSQIRVGVLTFGTFGIVQAEYGSGKFSTTHFDDLDDHERAKFSRIWEAGITHWMFLPRPPEKLPPTPKRTLRMLKARRTT